MTSCPACGAAREPDASFCEQCGHDFTAGAATPAAPAAPGAPGGAPAGPGETQTRQAPTREQTAAEGEESPLDVGWTGPVAGRGIAGEVAAAADPTCQACGVGHYDEGYCDQCGAKQPDPRDHFTEEPAGWLGGVCDIGKRHTRNEDAMALMASTRQLQQGVVVVCDGVSNSTDSHIASLAAARAAREVLDDPVPQAMGQPEARLGAMAQRLMAGVTAARQAVIEATPQPTGPTPPSCTFVAAIIDEGTAFVGNVGDSRAYWLPDDPALEPAQLSSDDSFAAEQMREGVPRKQAETGPQAHAITRWLGVDSPDDLTPHVASVALNADGWLLVCSDGLWNYCSDAHDLRRLVGEQVAALGPHGRHPRTLAGALVDFANAQGGMDNITVALARVGATDPAPPEPPRAAVQAPTGPTPFEGVPIEPPDPPATPAAPPTSATAPTPPPVAPTPPAAVPPPPAAVPPPPAAVPPPPAQAPPPPAQAAYPAMTTEPTPIPGESTDGDVHH